MKNIALRKQTRTTDLPQFQNDFMLAADAQEGMHITLPGKGSKKITHSEMGVDFNLKRVVLIYVEGDTVPESYSPRSYLPIS